MGLWGEVQDRGAAVVRVRRVSMMLARMIMVKVTVLGMFGV